MLQCRSLIVALLWHVISVEGGFTKNWSNWIILPARSRTSDDSFIDFPLNQSNLVNSYLDPVQMEPYFMRIRENAEEKREWHAPSEEDDNDNSSDDLIVPLGRAIENVKNFWAIVRDLFRNDNNVDDEGRMSTSRKLKKLKKKYKKFLLPLLIAYKLKFLTLIPVLIGGLILLVGTTGLAGFFFALFTAVMSLKNDNSKLEIKKW